MTIQIACPGCRVTLKIPEEAQGKQIRCPKCKVPVQVPAKGAGPKPQASAKPTPAAKQMLRSACPGCKAPVQVSMEKAGIKVRCQKCQAIFTLPGKKTTPPPGRTGVKPRRQKGKGLILTLSFLLLFGLIGGGIAFAYLQFFQGPNQQVAQTNAKKTETKTPEAPVVPAEEKKPGKEDEGPKLVPTLPEKKETPPVVPVVVKEPMPEKKTEPVPPMVVVKEPVPEKKEIPPVAPVVVAKESPEKKEIPPVAPVVVAKEPEKPVEVKPNPPVRELLPDATAQELQAELKNPETRIAALKKLEEAGPKGENLFPDTYAIAVNDDDPNLRAAGLRALGKLSHLAGAGAEGVYQILEDESEPESVREAAAKALGQMGKAGEPFLVQAVKNSDAKVRKLAFAGVSEMNYASDAVAEALATLLGDADAKIPAIRLLGTIGSKNKVVAKAVAAMMNEQEQSETLKLIFHTLEEFGDATQEILPEVYAFWKAHPESTGYVLQFYRRIPPHGRKLLPEIMKMLPTIPKGELAEFAEGVAWLDPGNTEVLPMLIKGLKDKPSFPDEVRIINTLRMYGPVAKEAAPFLVGKINAPELANHPETLNVPLANMGRGAVPELRKVWKDADPKLRLRILDLYKRMGPEAEEALPDLREALAKGEADIRAQVLQLLFLMGPAARPASGDILEGILKADMNGEKIALATCQGLAWIGIEEETVPKVVKYVKNAKVPARYYLTAILAGSEKAGVEALNAIAADKVKAVAKNANDTLKFLEKKKQYQEKLAVGKTGDGKARVQAALELGPLNPRDRASYSILAGALRDPDPEVRALALESLEKIRTFSGAKGTMVQALVHVVHDPASSKALREGALKAIKKLDYVAEFYLERPEQVVPKKVTVDPALAALHQQAPPRTRLLVETVDAPIRCPVKILGSKSAMVAVFERTTEKGDFKNQSRRGMLAREIVRQALLVCFKNELGLAVRDLAIKEVFAPQPEFATRAELELTCYFPLRKKNPRLALVRKAEPPVVLWEKELDVPPSDILDYPRLIAESERLARTEWPEVLQKEGFGKAGQAKTSTEPRLANAADRLDTLSVFSHYSLLRDLHGAMKAKGESPDLLADLVRGYANLGFLNDFLWTSHHKIYQARALLYAQRLHAQMPASSWASWHRAYAFALVGRHDDCLLELAAAQKHRAGEKEARPRPDWVDALDFYCQGKNTRLDDLAQVQPLARLLHFENVAEGVAKHRAVDAGFQLLKASPECFVAWDLLSQRNEIGVLHRTTVAGPLVLSAAIVKRLPEFRGLPAVVVAALKNRDEELDVDAERHILEKLIGSSKLGDDDIGLSWSGLGWMIRDIRYMQTLRRLFFMKAKWGVPTEEYYAVAEVLVKDHPFVPLLEAIGRKPDMDFEDRLVKAIESESTSLSMIYASRIKTIMNNKEMELKSTFIARQDDVFKDLILSLEHVPTSKVHLAKRLLKVSPHSVKARIALIKYDWANVRKDAEEWEQTDDVEILGALGQRYYENVQIEKAERCLTKFIKIAPEWSAVATLANLYKFKDEHEKFVETWDHFLRQPTALGLEQAQGQMFLAQHYRKKGEKEKALAYAEAAADTWAEWAMRIALECHEDLGNFEQAEIWVRRISERYDGNARDWLEWCRRTGRGDIDSATQVAAGKRTEKGALQDGLWHGVQEAVEERKWPVVFVASRELLNATKDPTFALIAALAAHEAKDSNARDAMLKTLPAGTNHEKLGQLFQKGWQKKGALDRKAVDQILNAEPGSLKTDGAFLTAWYLESQGDLKHALIYYDRCAQGPSSKTYMKRISLAVLEKNGQEPGKLKQDP